MGDIGAGPGRSRWAILALLFSARTVMAMQYQAIGALSPVLTGTFGIGLSEIGVLIGLYVAPGLVFALPGSAIGQRFGEKPVVIAALVLMGAGALLMASAEGWGLFVTGHVIAGFGGVLINILMTKMVADWFAGAEINTALAIYINSWPLGIALGLILFPPLVAFQGLGFVFWLLTALSLGMALAILRFYRAPDGAATGGGARVWPKGARLRAVIAAGTVWGGFNGGLAVLFGLGTVLLSGQGMPTAEAARSTSLILWMVAVSTPFGGIIADRTGQGALMIAIGVALLAVLSFLVPVEGLTLPIFLAYGCVSGMVAGPIMALPARVLGPSERIIGMGLFFTVYYVLFIAAPALAGALADSTGTMATAFVCAALFQAAAFLGLLLFLRETRLIRE